MSNKTSLVNKWFSKNLLFYLHFVIYFINMCGAMREEYDKTDMKNYSKRILRRNIVKWEIDVSVKLKNNFRTNLSFKRTSLSVGWILRVATATGIYGKYLNMLEKTLCTGKSPFFNFSSTVLEFYSTLYFNILEYRTLVCFFS